MDERDVPAYVIAAARAVGLALDDGTVQRVSAHLARTAQMAALLDAAPLAPHDEIAEVYRPAPFPAGEGEDRL